MIVYSTRLLLPVCVVTIVAIRQLLITRSLLKVLFFSVRTLQRKICIFEGKQFIFFNVNRSSFLKREASLESFTTFLPPFLERKREVIYRTFSKQIRWDNSLAQRDCGKFRQAEFYNRYTSDANSSDLCLFIVS